MRPIFSPARGIVAAVLVLGFAAEVHAGVARGLLLQRRGVTIRPPANIDSSPTIDALNNALKALGATDRDYNGHREKAITHVGAAIQHLETPNARGKSNATIEKAIEGKTASTKTAKTSQTASDESLRKAKAILFSVHHQLTDHTRTAGHLRADAQIRLAIDEIVAALNPPKTSPAKAATTTPAKPSVNPPSATPTKSAK